MKIKTLSELCKAKNFGSDKGSSLLMWKSWFRNAEITGIDNKMLGHNGREYNGINKIKADAYLDDTVNNFDDNSIDYLIDDGPHTLTSQLTCVEKYFSKIKPGGKIIIEDIQNCEEAQAAFQKLNVVKNSLCTFQVVDLRQTKNRYDDVLFVLKKSSTIKLLA